MQVERVGNFVKVSVPVERLRQVGVLNDQEDDTGLDAQQAERLMLEILLGMLRVCRPKKENH